MVRKLLVAATVLLAIVPAHLSAQAESKKMPMSGSVVDVTGAPLADAHVVLVRHTGRLPDSEGVEILAQGQTDSQGQFVFGDVALKTELVFPLETAIWLEYAVEKQGVTRQVETIRFTTPRTASIVTSVEAELHVR